MTRIILASKSPRRRELMEMLKLPFEIIVSDIDEQIDYDNDLVKEIEKLSFRKADAVYQENKDALVIGSDTIVKIGNDVLGKPKSVEQAKEMLRELSDNTHEVVTGVTIICNDQVETFSSVAKVTFYPLSEEEIDEYGEHYYGNSKHQCNELRQEHAEYKTADVIHDHKQQTDT